MLHEKHLIRNFLLPLHKMDSVMQSHTVLYLRHGSQIVGHSTSLDSKGRGRENVMRQEQVYCDGTVKEINTD